MTQRYKTSILSAPIRKNNRKVGKQRAQHVVAVPHFLHVTAQGHGNDRRMETSTILHIECLHTRVGCAFYRKQRYCSSACLG